MLSEKELEILTDYLYHAVPYGLRLMPSNIEDYPSGAPSFLVHSMTTSVYTGTPIVRIYNSYGNIEEYALDFRFPFKPVLRCTYDKNSFNLEEFKKTLPEHLQKYCDEYGSYYNDDEYHEPPMRNDAYLDVCDMYEWSKAMLKYHVDISEDEYLLRHDLAFDVAKVGDVYSINKKEDNG